MEACELAGDAGPTTIGNSALRSWMGSSSAGLGAPCCFWRRAAVGAAAWASPHARGACRTEHWWPLPRAEAMPQGCCRASMRALAPVGLGPFKGANGRRSWSVPPKSDCAGQAGSTCIAVGELPA